MFLSDAELIAEVTSTAGRMAPVIRGVVLPADRFSARSPVQPASVDLTIGGIHVPRTDPGSHGGRDRPRDSLILAPGATAVLITREEFDLPPDLGAIGFPPSTMFREGLLMTNPGHIDPGFKGPIQLTVVNVGSSDCRLDVGMAIVTILLFRVTPCTADYGKRFLASGPTKVAQRTLDSLSRDFLDVTARAKSEALKRAGLLSLLLLIIPIGWTFYEGRFGRSRETDERLTALEQLMGNDQATSVVERLRRLEEGVKK